MNDDYRESVYRSNNLLSVLTGMVIGSVAGASVMFFFAPQSGEKTRRQIQQKSIELVDQTSEMFEDAMTQVRKDGRKLTKDGRHMAREMLEQGQAMVAEKLEYVSDAARAGKKAVQKSVQKS